MKTRFITRWIILLISFFSISTAFAAESPAAVVEEGVSEVVAVAKDQSMDRGTRRDKMRTLIARRFDFNAMSRSILARNWKKASEEQRSRFVALFQTLLENTYMTTIESYTSEKIHFGSEKIKGRKAVVGVTIVLQRGSEAPLLFKLRNNGGQWAVYDVVIEGVSLVNNFRSNFRSIVKREGVEGLIGRLEQKVMRSNT